MIGRYLGTHPKQENWSVWRRQTFHGPDEDDGVRWWTRDEEGRSKLWRAAVYLETGQWFGTVWRNKPWRGGISHNVTGRWKLGPFATPWAAIGFTERWLSLRRSPSTWKAEDETTRAWRERFFPVGDYGEVRIENEGADLRRIGAEAVPEPPAASERSAR